MNNPTPSPANNQRIDQGQESLLSIADLEHAAKVCSEATSDPLDRFPHLQGLARHACFDNLGMELAANGVHPVLASRAAAKAYSMVTLAVVSIHNAIWNSVLPSTDDAPKA